MAVASVFPTIAGDFVGAANATSREDDCFGAENLEASALALIPESADYSVAIFQQGKNRMFHVDLDSLMNPVILKRADHFQAGAIADMRETGIFVTAEIPLQNPAVLCPIENCAPSFKLPHTVRRFHGVQFGHAPVIDVLATAHGIGEMHLPVVPLIDIG